MSKKSKKSKNVWPALMDEASEAVVQYSSGLSQEQMMVFLHRLQGKLCAYSSGTGGSGFCDCKYDMEHNGESIGSRGEYGNGCPEVRQALSVILAMTPKEYEKMQKRASNKRMEKMYNETYEEAKGAKGAKGAKVKTKQ